jgi:cyclase
MTLTRRLIVCLDVDGGRVVKGTQFLDLRDCGDPVALAARYEAAGADEIVFLDITATASARATTLELVRQTAERLFIPLTVGGGIASVQSMSAALRAGADKVAVNSAAVRRPALITECAERFGAQCVVASIDAKRDGERWRIVIAGGREATELDAVEWAVECARLGAGEVLVTSVDNDGTRAGYDLALTRAIADAVAIPVIASGGASSPADVCEAFVRGGADAALVAGIVHDGTTTVGALKRAMRDASLSTREVAA